MVQKTVSRVARARKPAAKAPEASPKKRGRPRAYDPDQALARAMDVFWREGFSATSLDQLSAATGMNRPSLYGAFGDKRELYIKAYDRYRLRARERMAEVFGADLSLRALLQRVFGIALDMYLSGTDGPRGCFSVMTATSEAIFDPEIRNMVVSGIAEMDKAFARAFKLAQQRGELSASADVGALAQIATATIHTIAVRARAKVPRKELEAITNGAIDLICGQSGTSGPR
jgi:TetR/AcrR family transcriptional regulator, copper-responsive repressor